MELITQTLSAGCNDTYEWNGQSWDYVGKVCEEEHTVIDLSATLAVAELRKGDGNWSAVYAGMDGLLSTGDLDAKQLTGWTALQFDDDRDTEWKENHSLFLT